MYQYRTVPPLYVHLLIQKLKHMTLRGRDIFSLCVQWKAVCCAVLDIRKQLLISATLQVYIRLEFYAKSLQKMARWRVFHNC